MTARHVWITGIGIVSSLGEGTDAHLAALANSTSHVDAETFAPYGVHAAAPVAWDQQIPKKADQRQMEPWQKLGVYAAGLALADAGLKDDKAALGAMDLIVAAGGGERDWAVDGQILTDLPKSNTPGALLNERLMNDLRPTLFLAQLSNLLAGNISIVHGVTGGTRTFMGEEQAGVDAVRIAAARIAAGQADTVLVGGSYNAERPDILMIYEMAGLLWKKPFRSVFEREADGGGFLPGSGGAFVVLEGADTAKARGATPLARLAAIEADRGKRDSGGIARTLAGLAGKARVPADFAGLVLSGATGVAGITGEEQQALATLAPRGEVKATGDLFGHMLEAQFPAGLALAAAQIRAGGTGAALVSSVGHVRGEGLAHLVKAD